jgi:hypothetical protein
MLFGLVDDDQFVSGFQLSPHLIQRLDEDLPTPIGGDYDADSCHFRSCP